MQAPEMSLSSSWPLRARRTIGCPANPCLGTCPRLSRLMGRFREVVHALSTNHRDRRSIALFERPARRRRDPQNAQIVDRDVLLAGESPTPLAPPSHLLLAHEQLEPDGNPEHLNRTCRSG